MKLKVGVVGTGAIGREHITRITKKLSGAVVTAVTDVNPEGAKAAAEICGAKVFPDALSLIQSPDVDAVLVSSPGFAHKDAVLPAIRAGKPVFCEKPMATTAADCREIVDAELAAGRKLVQVGFQRRYDKGYLQMKQYLSSGDFGAPLVVHCAHRNADTAPTYDTPMAVHDTAIHEIDVLHWLIDDEYESAQVFLPRKSCHAREILHDPQIMILRTKGGIHIDIEVFVSCRYGYDIQCEVCCENGIIKLPEPSFPTIRKNALRSVPLETDWKERFIEAYDVEIQDWINATLEGKVNGPTGWDGYVAAVTADALVRAQTSGKVELIETGERPALYR